MSGSTSIDFVDFAAFSFYFDRARCALSRSFLVRNWCGQARAELTLDYCDLQPVAESQGQISPRDKASSLAVNPLTHLAEGLSKSAVPRIADRSCIAAKRRDGPEGDFY